MEVEATAVLIRALIRCVRWCKIPHFGSEINQPNNTSGPASKGNLRFRSNECRFKVFIPVFQVHDITMHFLQRIKQEISASSGPSHKKITNVKIYTKTHINGAKSLPSINPFP